MKDRGPYFGVGDLKVCSEPFNKPNACVSDANTYGYYIPEESFRRKNMLTNKSSAYHYDGHDSLYA
jgi:hypothetical protein